MAVKIRLTKLGRKNDPKYRLVAAEEHTKRDGKYIDLIGSYDPVKDPAVIIINEEKLKAWTLKGAQLSDGAEKLLKHYRKNGKTA